jgi:nucleoside-diphosphate-sugar epimerase
MRIFITGATGYIGGAVAERLIAAGHTVLGLARSQEKAKALAARGIEPVIGKLSDLDVIRCAAAASDGVVNAASAEDSPVAHALCAALEGTGKALVHTSGTSVAADRALGEPGGVVHTEDMPLDTLPERLLRVAIDRHVLAAAGRGVRSVVIRPSLIYGRGRGLNPFSHQVPKLAAVARDRGRPVHVGRGLAVWSNVHIDDVADLYVRALLDSPAGHVYFAANGEASWRDLAVDIGRALGLDGEPEALDIGTALEIFGISAVTSFSSNSRVSSEKARRMLGWAPKGASLEEQLANDPAWP